MIKQINPTIELRSERVILQPLASCKAQSVLDYYLRNKQHLAPTDPPHPEGFHTIGFWEERIILSKAEMDEGSAYRFVMCLPGDRSQLIGTVSLTQISRGPFQACYLGYGIDFEFEGKGLMTESIKLVIRFAFGELNLHRIMANHLVTNTRSSKLLKGLGFEQEGVAKSYLYIAGQWRDHVLNSLINSQWNNRVEYFVGEIILESLVAPEVLDSFKPFLVSTRTATVKNFIPSHWNIHRYRMPNREILRLMPLIENNIDKNQWYIHFYSEKENKMYVTLSGKTFLLAKFRDSSWEEMILYGEKVGVGRRWTENIPVDFHKESSL